MNEHITVVGNIANAPEPRSLPGGEPIARFRLAATSQKRQQDGTWVDAHTSWYTVSAYRRLAEHVLASLTKGQRVIVTGRFRVRHWEAGDKQGTEAEIDADAVGPDLLFGTATFHRDERNRVATRPQEESAGHTEWAPSVEEQSGQVVGAAQAEESATVAPAPDLVGAGTWDTRPLGDSTPF